MQCGSLFSSILIIVALACNINSFVVANYLIKVADVRSNEHTGRQAGRRVDGRADGRAGRRVDGQAGGRVDGQPGG